MSYFKKFLECIGLNLGYLAKLNEGLKLVSGANLQHVFQGNFPLHNTLPFLPVEILNNSSFKFLLRQMKKS